RWVVVALGRLAAYGVWGVFRRETGRLLLTGVGVGRADSFGPECRLQREILHRVPAYQVAVRKIYDEGLDIATHLDVLRHWAGLQSVEFDEATAQDMEAAAVCFFSLCHAAELGTSTVGKRGQPARLRADMDQIGAFLNEVFEENPQPAAQRRTPVYTPIQIAAGPIRQVLVSTSGS